MEPSLLGAGPLVSVVIPTRNRSHLVKEAVASALAQDGVPMEVIVVDDGSTDGTLQALAPFGKSPSEKSPSEKSIDVIVQAHRGVSAARNHGVERSRGRWIAFLDSDDLWLPGKLSAQISFLARNPHVKICQTEEIWLRDGKRINPKRYHRKPSGHCFPKLLERCLVSPSAVLLCADLFRKVGGFDETLPACEDYDLWLRIGYSHPIGLIEKPFVVKRGGHGDQLSATVPSLDLYRIRSLARLLLTQPLSSGQQEEALKVLAAKCRIYGEGCRKRQREEEGQAIRKLPGILGKKLQGNAVSMADDLLLDSIAGRRSPFS